LSPDTKRRVLTPEDGNRRSAGRGWLRRRRERFEETDLDEKKNGVRTGIERPRFHNREGPKGIQFEVLETRCRGEEIGIGEVTAVEPARMKRKGKGKDQKEAEPGILESIIHSGNSRDEGPKEPVPGRAKDVFPAVQTCQIHLIEAEPR
jgi:hypothetical protein